MARRRLSKLAFWLTLLIAAVVAAILATANRHVVQVDFSPLPFAFDLPLFVVVFGSVFLGMVVTAGAAWFWAGKWRRQARERGRTIGGLRAEVANLRAATAKPVAQPPVPRKADAA